MKGITALALACATLAGGAVINVKPGTNSLRSAMYDAKDGDTLILAPGVYNEDPPIFVNKTLEIFGNPHNNSLINASIISMPLTAFDTVFNFGSWEVVLNDLVFADLTNTSRVCFIGTPPPENNVTDTFDMQANPARSKEEGILSFTADFSHWFNSRKVKDIAFGTECTVSDVNDLELKSKFMVYQARDCHMRAGFTASLSSFLKCGLEERNISAVVNGTLVNVTEYTGTAVALFEQEEDDDKNTKYPLAGTGDSTFLLLLGENNSTYMPESLHNVTFNGTNTTIADGKFDYRKLLLKNTTEPSKTTVGQVLNIGISAGTNGASVSIHVVAPAVPVPAATAASGEEPKYPEGPKVDGEEEEEEPMFYKDDLPRFDPNFLSHTVCHTNADHADMENTERIFTAGTIVHVITTVIPRRKDIQLDEIAFGNITTRTPEGKCPTRRPLDVTPDVVDFNNLGKRVTFMFALTDEIVCMDTTTPSTAAAAPTPTYPQVKYTIFDGSSPNMETAAAAQSPVRREAGAVPTLEVDPNTLPVKSMIRLRVPMMIKYTIITGRRRRQVMMRYTSVIDSIDDLFVVPRPPPPPILEETPSSPASAAVETHAPAAPVAPQAPVVNQPQPSVQHENPVYAAAPTPTPTPTTVPSEGSAAASAEPESGGSGVGGKTIFTIILSCLLVVGLGAGFFLYRRRAKRNAVGAFSRMGSDVTKSSALSSTHMQAGKSDAEFRSNSDFKSNAKLDPMHSTVDVAPISVEKAEKHDDDVIDRN